MIHYHGTPCGATRTDVVRFLSGRHALVSFVRPEDLGAALEVCQTVMLDNGAFSAWQSGEPISEWGEYYAFVRNVMRHPAFDFAVIPDVIDGDESANDALIAEWSATFARAYVGAPVWHLHESTERLLRLVRDWPRVCLGSSGEFASVGTEKWWSRMSEAMAMACDRDGRPRCKLHGLRMLDVEVFSRLPLASADSTNAVRNSSALNRFGWYVPPTASQRMEVIAARVEAVQSAPVWTRGPVQMGMFFKAEESEVA